ncbi:MAG: hypothetical protein V7641_459, partial [Blastocatellia bacterium]
NSCFDCHSVTAGMQDKCIDCHQTQATATAAAFVPTIYDAHDREGMACSSCHTEHQGKDIHAGLVAYQLCANCHNGAYKIKTGERTAKLLPVPHGGQVGYPVVYGKWEWKLTPDVIKRKGYPDAWASLEPRDQFHAVHQMDRMLGRMSCGDCHTRGSAGDEAFRTSPKDECAKCHGVSFTVTSAATAPVNCNACHVQHGQKNDLAGIVTHTGKDPPKSQLAFDVVDSRVIEKLSPFDHNRIEHQTRSRDCAFCHQQPDNSNTSGIPHHSACNECHQRDYIIRQSRMCAVCHTTPVDALGTLLDPVEIKKSYPRALLPRR